MTSLKNVIIYDKLTVALHWLSKNVICHLFTLNDVKTLSI